MESDNVMNDCPWAVENFKVFEATLNGNSETKYHQVRKKAFSRFQELGVPRADLEEWKYTNVTQLAKLQFKSVVKASQKLSVRDLQSLIPLETKHRVVFVDGFFDSSLSSVNFLPDGVKLFTSASSDDLFKQAANNYQDNAFSALNTAFSQEGVVCKIAKNVVVSDPISLVFITSSDQSGVIIHPKMAVLVGANSKATFVESYFGMGSGVYFNNVVTEFMVGENSEIDHYKIQCEGSQAYHVGSLYLEQARSSRFSTFLCSVGGALVRNEIYPVLNGTGIDCKLNGLSVLSDNQQVDNFTVIDHAQPHCESTEIFKGIFAGSAKGAFSGTIIVRPDAQKTNAIQSNNNILLSEEASVYTRPQLKIYADDVKCTHGATVGQLDNEAMFYLQSRGINQSDARNILIKAFAGEVLGQVKLSQLKNWLENIISEKLSSVQ